MIVAYPHPDYNEAFADEWTERQAMNEASARESEELPADLLTNAEMGTAWLAAMAQEFTVQEVGGYGLLAAYAPDGSFLAGGLTVHETARRARLVLAAG